MTKRAWRYGNAWEEFPIRPSEIWSIDGEHMVAIHNVFDPLPSWVKADVVFSDPPWGTGNLRAFYTKAGLSERPEFAPFTEALKHRIAESSAREVFLYNGLAVEGETTAMLKNLFPHVQRWEMTYGKRRKEARPMVLLYAGEEWIDLSVEGLDEQDALEIVAERLRGKTVLDLCAGMGDMPIAVYRHGGQFIALEMNPRRLAHVLRRAKKLGGEICRV